MSEGKSEKERGAFYQGALVTHTPVMESIRRANTDPEMARLLIKCLIEICTCNDNYATSLHADLAKLLASHADDEFTLNCRKQLAELNILQGKSK